MENQKKTIEMVSGFAKANPETIERLNAAAREMLNPCRQELTAKELEAAQVALILPYIRNAARHAENMVEHYQDILESGEATDRQTTTLAQWEDKMDFFNSMIAFME